MLLFIQFCFTGAKRKLIGPDDGRQKRNIALAEYYNVKKMILESKLDSYKLENEKIKLENEKIKLENEKILLENEKLKLEIKGLKGDNNK